MNKLCDYRTKDLILISVGIDDAEGKIASSVPKKAMERKHIDSTILIIFSKSIKIHNLARKSSKIPTYN